MSLGIPKPSFDVPLGHFWIHAFIAATSAFSKLCLCFMCSEESRFGRARHDAEEMVDNAKESRILTGSA